MEKNSLDEKVALMRSFLEENSMQNVNNRIKSLKLLYKNIKSMQNEICEALKEDLNKSAAESYMTEIGMTLSEISYMIKHTKKFARPKRVHTPLNNFPAKSFRLASPYGIVLVISPWNYPFMLSLEPLVDAVAAGNSVILKPSSTSVNTTKILNKLITKTFDAGHVTLIGGHDDSNYLIENDMVDNVFYTGSTRVGETIMKKTAEHFIPVTLEMGGKSPCIVDETANISLAAKRIIWGKLLNAGQTCVAPDYIYCHSSIKDKLANELIRQIILQYSTDPLSNANYPKMINKKQFDLMLNLIDRQKVIFGGKYNERTLKIEPTIVNANFEDECMKNEIFGPIIPMVTFENLDEVISTVNSKFKPLALYMFSNSKTNQNKILNRCEFGGGCVNDTIMHIANSRLGFGGLKQSGIGAYHGKVGFDTFTHYKSIVKKSNLIDLPLRYQPTSKIKQSLIKKFLK